MAEGESNIHSPVHINTLTLAEVNPYYTSLRIRKFKGNFKGYYSISINMKYRIMLDFIIRDDKVILLDIGGHDYLYC